VTITEIKAELYDLQNHVCNGRLIMNPDSIRDRDFQPCHPCARIVVLTNMLHGTTRRDGCNAYSPWELSVRRSLLEEKLE